MRLRERRSEGAGESFYQLALVLTDRPDGSWEFAVAYFSIRPVVIRQIWNLRPKGPSSETGTFDSIYYTKFPGRPITYDEILQIVFAGSAWCK